MNNTSKLRPSWIDKIIVRSGVTSCSTRVMALLIIASNTMLDFEQREDETLYSNAQTTRPSSSTYQLLLSIHPDVSSYAWSLCYRCWRISVPLLVALGIAANPVRLELTGGNPLLRCRKHRSLSIVLVRPSNWAELSAHLERKLQGL